MSNGGALLKEAVYRQLYIEGEDEYFYEVDAYTVPEAAVALGRTALTLKRWIKDRLIPQPRLIGGNNYYKHYSVGELQLIADILIDHEQDYDYLHHTHTTTVNRLWNELDAYRETYV